MGAYIKIRPFFHLASQQTLMKLWSYKKGNYNNGNNRAYAFKKNCLAFTPKRPRRLVENLVRVLLGRLLCENLARAGFGRVHRFARDYVVQEIETICSQHA
jgi:hypothetical protein